MSTRYSTDVWGFDNSHSSVGQNHGAVFDLIVSHGEDPVNINLVSRLSPLMIAFLSSCVNRANVTADVLVRLRKPG
jgi:hypothetical protein